LGELSKANHYFQEVLTLHPQHATTLIELGLIANKVGNTDEVEKTHITLKTIDGELDEEFIEALKLSQTGCSLEVATSAC